MRRKVIVREMVRTDDLGGGWTEAIEDVGEWWAAIEPLAGDELLRALQVGMVQPYRFKGHYRASLTTAKELVFEGVAFDIKSIIDTDAAHREMKILADKGVP